MGDKAQRLRLGRDLSPRGAFVSTDTGLHRGETFLEVNGLRVECGGDEAAALGLALMAGALTEDALRAWTEEHRKGWL